MNDACLELAHDLRLPLQQILCCAQLIEAETDAGSPAAAHAALVVDAVRAASAMLERRLRAPDEPRLEVVELVGWLRELKRRYGPAAERNGVKLRASANVAELRALTDEGLLSRLAGNLISNALRFTPAGGRVALRLTARGDCFELSVRDSGPGIAPEDLPRAFLPGETDGGHGFGLPIASRLARRLGGTLDAASTPGRGARFRLRLPVAPREAAANPHHPEVS